MTQAQRRDLMSRNYIFFGENYYLTMAMNELFKEEWLMEAEESELFSPPVEMLTKLGKLAMNRLKIIRDEFGVTLTENMLVQVYLKLKQEENEKNNFRR